MIVIGILLIMSGVELDVLPLILAGFWSILHGIVRSIWFLLKFVAEL